MIKKVLTFCLVIGIWFSYLPTHATYRRAPHRPHSTSYPYYVSHPSAISYPRSVTSYPHSRSYPLATRASRPHYVSHPTAISYPYHRSYPLTASYPAYARTTLPHASSKHDESGLSTDGLKNKNSKNYRNRHFSTNTSKELANPVSYPYYVSHPSAISYPRSVTSYPHSRSYPLATRASRPHYVSHPTAISYPYHRSYPLTASYPAYAHTTLPHASSKHDESGLSTDGLKNKNSKNYRNRHFSANTSKELANPVSYPYYVSHPSAISYPRSVTSYPHSRSYPLATRASRPHYVSHPTAISYPYHRSYPLTASYPAYARTTFPHASSKHDESGLSTDGLKNKNSKNYRNRHFSANTSKELANPVSYPYYVSHPSAISYPRYPSYPSYPHQKARHRAARVCNFLQNGKLVDFQTTSVYSDSPSDSEMYIIDSEGNSILENCASSTLQEQQPDSPTYIHSLSCE